MTKGKVDRINQRMADLQAELEAAKREEAEEAKKGQVFSILSEKVGGSLTGEQGVLKEIPVPPGFKMELVVIGTHIHNLGFKRMRKHTDDVAA